MEIWMYPKDEMVKKLFIIKKWTHLQEFSWEGAGDYVPGMWGSHLHSHGTLQLEILSPREVEWLDMVTQRSVAVSRYVSKLFVTQT